MPEQLKDQPREQPKGPIDPNKIDPKKRQLTIAEYKALQAQETNKFKIKIPLVVKLIMALPLFAIFLFGLFYIPFLAIKGCSPDSTESSSPNR